jgi:hypothetical protein
MCCSLPHTKPVLNKPQEVDFERTFSEGATVHMERREGKRSEALRLYPNLLDNVEIYGQHNTGSRRARTVAECSIEAGQAVRRLQHNPFAQFLMEKAAVPVDPGNVSFSGVLY